MPKDRVEESCRLTIGWFQRHGYLQDAPQMGRSSWTGPGARESVINWQAAAPVVRLIYSVTPRWGEKQDFDYLARVVYTPLPNGGRRAWWLCPLCRRRCATLYLPPAGRMFGCRLCHDLAYTAQQDRDELGKRASDPERDLRHMERLAALLARTDRQFAPPPLPAPPAPAEPAIKRPRGRPRTKRKYTRRAPLAA